MRWPRHKKGERVSEATVARQQAERELERVKAETAEYVKLGKSLREIRERNHLTELILAIPTRRHG